MSRVRAHRRRWRGGVLAGAMLLAACGAHVDHRYPTHAAWDGEAGNTDYGSAEGWERK